MCFGSGNISLKCNLVSETISLNQKRLFLLCFCFFVSLLFNSLSLSVLFLTLYLCLSSFKLSIFVSHLLTFYLSLCVLFLAIFLLHAQQSNQPDSGSLENPPKQERKTNQKNKKNKDKKHGIPYFEDETGCTRNTKLYFCRFCSCCSSIPRNKLARNWKKILKRIIILVISTN